LIFHLDSNKQHFFFNFVVGNRGSVVESDFYTKLNKLDIQEGKKDKLFADM